MVVCRRGKRTQHKRPSPAMTNRHRSTLLTCTNCNTLCYSYTYPRSVPTSQQATIHTTTTEHHGDYNCKDFGNLFVTAYTFLLIREPFLAMFSRGSRQCVIRCVADAGSIVADCCVPALLVVRAIGEDDGSTVRTLPTSIHCAIDRGRPAPQQFILVGMDGGR